MNSFKSWEVKPIIRTLNPCLNFVKSYPQHVGWLLRFHAKVPVFLILHEVTWVECFLTQREKRLFASRPIFSRARDMWQCFDCSCALVSHSAELLMDPIMNQIIFQMTHIFFNQQIFLETADRNLAGVLGWQQETRKLVSGNQASSIMT